MCAQWVWSCAIHLYTSNLQLSRLHLQNIQKFNKRPSQSIKSDQTVVSYLLINHYTIIFMFRIQRFMIFKRSGCATLSKFLTDINQTVLVINQPKLFT